MSLIDNSPFARIARTASVASSTPVRRSEWNSLAIAIGCQVASLVVIALLVGTHAWDDGAITLAYSRTFAETGRIALTAASEQSEGFSSVAWFLINAAIALTRPGFEGAILGAQLLAGACLCISIVFAWSIARSLRLRTDTTIAVLIAFAMFGPSIAETANGMEMTLLTAAGLGLCVGLYFSRSLLLVSICTGLFLLTRFEAMVYFAAMIAPLLLQRRYKEFASLAIFGLCVVGFQEYVRYEIFQDIVPNTIHAKAHAPYYQSGWNAMTSRVCATFEPFPVVLPFVVAGGILLLLTKQNRPALLLLSHDRNTALVLLAPVVAVVAFSALIGSNWGYMGRMQFLAFPFMLLLFGVVFDSRSKVLGPAKARAVLIAATGLTIVLSWQLSAAQPLGAAADTIRIGNAETARSFDVTPAAYRDTGVAVEELRRILGKDAIVFMTSDVGGLGLCCSHVRIVDLGLLTNRRLAREGYGATAAVLMDEKPDIIEAHQRWARLSELYQLAEFTQNYRPAIINDTRFFVRADVFDTMLAKNGTLCVLSQADCRKKARDTHRYAGSTWPADDDAFLSYGTFVVF